MKDSGVEWLGSVPTHWNVQRLATLYREANREGDPSLPVLSISIHDGISDEELTSEERERQVRHIEDRAKYKRVKANDLAYNMMRAWQGAFGAAQVEGLVSPAYVVAEPTGGTHSTYMELLLRTPMAVEEMRRFSRGIADFRSRLYWEHFRDIRVCVPPSKEQQTILTALERETARIDKLIAHKARFIELLAQKRQALIAHVVTKGLDPDAKMKDSGVQWLGNVPEHWTVKRLRFLCDITTGGRDTVDAVPDGRYPFFIRSPEVLRIDTFAADCEAVLTPGEGDIGKIFHHHIGRFDFHQRVYMMNNFREVIGKFFYYYIKALFAAVTMDGSKKTTVDSLRMPVFKNFHFVVPRQREQEQIVSYLDQETAGIDSLIVKTELSIELLREHRTALITAAVTGKIDLREAT